jgi:spore coat polysaccharide biosynthesis predicted glycosyltransferase SpsG
MDNDKKVWFRVDAGAHIGMGHLARCLALAARFAKAGYQPRFVINDDEAARALLESNGFEYDVADTGGDPDYVIERAGEKPLVVTDLRGYPFEYYSRIRKSGGFVASIDDVGDALPCNIVINGAIAGQFRDYDEIEPPQLFLLGPDYIPLRAEFAQPGPGPLGPARTNLLLTFGGADPSGYTLRAMTATETLPEMAVDLVLGAAFADAYEVKDIADKSANNYTIHNPAGDFRALMRRAKLAISAGGITLYELLTQRVPVMAVPASSREAGDIAELDRRGAIMQLPTGIFDEPDELAGVIAQLWDDGKKRGELADSGSGIIDGKGTERIVETVLKAYDELIKQGFRS